GINSVGERTRWPRRNAVERHRTPERSRRMLEILHGPRGTAMGPGMRTPAQLQRWRTAPAARLSITYGPGLLLALAIAIAASLLAQVLPLAGGAVLAIVLGIAVRARLGLSARYVPGVRLASKRLLQVAIVLLGAGLSLAQVWQTGRSSLLV